MFYVFSERLLAAQNPLTQATLPHQLFADAPPSAVQGQMGAPPPPPVGGTYITGGNTVNTHII